MPPPFLPVTRPNIDDETIADVAAVLKSGWLASGPKVIAFEKALSAYLGGRIVRSCTSATAALQLVLEVCGITKGDEVILPAMSFVATANVIVRVGAKPVFVDIDLVTRNINLEQAEAAITPRTRAMMPVHFAGRCVDMDHLYSLANKHKFRVIEDAAHAIGSSWKGKRIGSFGDIACFSFHPNKNITTIEGGVACFSDSQEAENFSVRRYHGIEKDTEGRMDVKTAAGKYNLSDVAAAVGLGQLRRLDEFNENRRKLVARYFELLEKASICEVPSTADDGHSWHMFNILLPLDRLRISRVEFMKQMEERGIGVGNHYPAMHLFSAYRQYGYRDGDFPNAERVGRETITLPLFSEMEIGDVERVCSNLIEIVEKNIK